MMEFASPALRWLTAGVLLLVLSACQKSDDADESVPLASTPVTTTPISGDAPPLEQRSASRALPATLDAALSAVMGATEIPYPVYPNGTKYRVGGENGLKIVVFQTDDAFPDVDRYYREATDNDGMARLIAMNDYVRYSRDSNDDDPWATHRPGIVIHQFNGEDEREAVGASKSARTNIIMSF